MSFNKRISYYIFGLLIGLAVVYFITSKKNTEFNYLPTKRVINDLKKKKWVFDETFTNIKKDSFLFDIEINFSESLINVDTCNIYQLYKRKKNKFQARNCTKKVYFSNFSSSK